jgi:hypothetical protein
MCITLQGEILKSVAVVGRECVVVLGHVEEFGVIFRIVVDVPLTDGWYVIDAVEEIGCEVSVRGPLGNIVAECTQLCERFSGRV